jgi:hypothetical protein
MTRRRLTVFIVLVGLLGIHCAWAQTQPTYPRSFPGHSTSTSPNGRYVLINIETVVGNEYRNTVVLEDRTLKTKRTMFDYERHIEILWNPNSKFFALSDFAGSDVAECRVISVDPNIEPVPVLDNLLPKLSPAERESILRNDHLYVQAIAWINNETLKIKIWGHDSGARTEFSHFYRYRISRQASR